MLKVALLGATGYAGQQLTALLLGHPHVQIHTIGSNGSAGRRFSDDYGKFSEHLGAEDEMVSPDDLLQELYNCDVLFLALPHGASTKYVTAVLKNPDFQHLKIIDLGSDFRLSSTSTGAVYGLCEMNRALIKKANFVANPGCYPTAAVLALKPFWDSQNLIREALKLEVAPRSTCIIDAKSGISGAGRNALTKHLFAEIYGNAYPYRLTDHPHTTEIETALNLSQPLQFTPNIIPVNRGIIENIYLQLKPTDDALNSQLHTAPSSEAVEHLFQELYSDYYRQSTFVRIRKDRLPMLSDVTHTNHCDIGFKFNERTGQLMIISTLDNLIKGAAGQAVQNMNLMCGFEEATGLIHQLAHL